MLQNRYEDIHRMLTISSALKALDERSFLFREAYMMGYPKFTNVKMIDASRRMTAYVSINDSGGTIFVWGREFFDELTDDALYSRSTTAVERVAFVLAHETLHIVLRHVERSSGKLPNVWNWACDIVVNWLCGDFYGLPVLPSACTAASVEEAINNHRAAKGEPAVSLGIDPSKQSCEQIYEILLQHIDVEVSFQPGSGCHDGWEKLDDRTKEILGAKVTEAVARAAQKDADAGKNDGDDDGSKGCGKLPGNADCGELREIADQIVADNRIPWERMLANRIGSLWQPGITERWDRLAPRLGSQWGRIIMPSRRVGYAPDGIRILAALDASGSMSEDDIGRMASLLSSLPDRYKVTIASFDTRCYIIPDLRSIRGGGGTSLHDVNRVAEEISADLVVCLTDGYFGDAGCVARPNDWVFVIDGTVDYVPQGSTVFHV